MKNSLLYKKFASKTQFPPMEFIKKSLFFHLKRLQLDDDDESFISFLKKSSNITKYFRRTRQNEGHHMLLITRYTRVICVLMVSLWNMDKANGTELFI